MKTVISIHSFLSIALVFVCLSGACCFPASAQRTAPGSWHVAGSWVTPFYSLGGGELSGGRYGVTDQWQAAVGAVNRQAAETGSGEMVDLLRVRAEGRWLFRVFNTRSRALNVYAGAGLFVGAELLDPSSRLSPSTESGLSNNGYSGTAFIYGLSPRLEAELFVSEWVALYGSVSVPVCMGTRLPSVIDCEAGVGVRFNFF